MANHFVKASFVLAVTDPEAEVFRDVETAAGILDDTALSPEERLAAYDVLGEPFRACFPPSEADPFGGFLAIFSDPDYPRLGFSIGRSGRWQRPAQGLDPWRAGRCRNGGLAHSGGGQVRAPLRLRICARL